MKKKKKSILIAKLRNTSGTEKLGNHSKGTERLQHETDRLSKPTLHGATRRGREMMKWWTEDLIMGIAYYMGRIMFTQLTNKKKNAD